MGVNRLLGSSAFIVLNKSLAHKVGVSSAILLSDLLSKEEYFKNRNMLNDGWFHNTSENIRLDTTLSYFQQKKAIDNLTKQGFLETDLRGIPAKLHFRLFYNNISSFLKTTMEETENLNTNNIDNYIINNKNKIKNKNNKEAKIKINIPPSFDDVKAYFNEKNINGEDEKFYDFYNSKGWFVGRNKMKCWKSAIRNWIRGMEKQESKKYPSHYDSKFVRTLDNQEVNEYYKHLRGLGYKITFSPTAGVVVNK